MEIYCQKSEKSDFEKIANFPVFWPFTTLEPHLGVVDLGDYKTIVVADIPGLIEGAHAGAGLGDRFLRHIERTKLLLHLIDISGLARDPVADYKTITRELEAYSNEVAGKPKIVLATKIDAVDDADLLKELKEFCHREGLSYYAISAATGQGLKEMLGAVEQRLDKLELDKLEKIDQGEGEGRVHFHHT